MNKLSPSSPEQTAITFLVPPQFAGMRLDHLVAEYHHGFSLTRSRAQQLIRDGAILVSKQERKSGYRVRENELVEITLPPPQPTSLIPRQIDFVVLYEDDDLIVVSKPPGLVVHPSHGHSDDTLVHGLLHHCSHLSGVGGTLRPGVVHRLDMDTSGVMVAAKNDLAHQGLIEQFKGRSVEKSYLALLVGVPSQREGRIVNHIGRHPIHRKKMAVLEHGGREAVTGWRVIEEPCPGFSFVALGLETGRTHQIRVHMAWLGCPIIGDALYGRKKKGALEQSIDRQCLHSHTLRFSHPRSGERLSFEAPLWPDMQELLQRMRDEAQAAEAALRGG